jgi:hypothetical protein
MVAHPTTSCTQRELRRWAGDSQTPPAHASLAALRDWLLDAYTPIYVELSEQAKSPHRYWRRKRRRAVGASLCPPHLRGPEDSGNLHIGCQRCDNE